MKEVNLFGLKGPTNLKVYLPTVNTETNESYIFKPKNVYNYMIVARREYPFEIQELSEREYNSTDQ